MNLSDDTIKKITIRYPADIPEALGLTGKAFAGEVLYLAAVKLFEQSRLTSEQAARLAGLPRLDFIRQLKTLGVTGFDLEDEELDAQVDTVEDLAG